MNLTLIKFLIDLQHSTSLNLTLFSSHVQGFDLGSHRAFVEHLPLDQRQLSGPPRLSPHHPPLSLAGSTPAFSPSRNTKQGQTALSHGLIGPELALGPVSCRTASVLLLPVVQREVTVVDC